MHAEFSALESVPNFFGAFLPNFFQRQMGLQTYVIAVGIELLQPIACAFVLLIVARSFGRGSIAWSRIGDAVNPSPAAQRTLAVGPVGDEERAIPCHNNVGWLEAVGVILCAGGERYFFHRGETSRCVCLVSLALI